MSHPRLGAMVLGVLLAIPSPTPGAGLPTPPVPHPATPGAGPPGEAPAPTPDPPSLGGEALRAVLALGAVFVVLALGGRAARRWPWVVRGRAAPGALQVLGRVALSSKEAVCLVRAGAEILVVGQSPGGLTLLSRLDPGALDASPQRAARPAAAPPAAAQEGRGGGGAAAGRLLELAARAREVQAAWAGRHPAAGDPR